MSAMMFFKLLSILVNDNNGYDQILKMVATLPVVFLDVQYHISNKCFG